MKVKRSNPTSTQASLSVIATEEELSPIKTQVLARFKSQVKVPGFRAGKVPLEILEKNINQAIFQSEFLDEAIGQLYFAAIDDQKLRPVDQPKISLKKFVPFTTLEFEAEVDVLGEINLADYKKLKLTRPKSEVTMSEVNEVVASLRQQLAERFDVVRPAKIGDQVFIDFVGADAKTGKPQKGADGKNYPLILGSKTFIDGFESEIVGMKAGEEKKFVVKFPKDYGAKALQNKKVSFQVSLIKVQEVKLPKLDDEFAKKVGPVKSVAELKSDVKKQLIHEKQHQLEKDYESELIKKLSDKSKLEIPEILINDQVERLWSELKQNITYRGQTTKEFIESEGTTEEKYRQKVLKPQAYERVKASLVLAEIAELERLEVTPEELEIRMQLLKGQYQDKEMQEQLEKPETRRDIASRLLTEKTLDRLKIYASSK